MRIVALTGPKGCGKDTAAAGLLDINDIQGANYFRQQMMAGTAKQIARVAFDLSEEQIEDRVLKETTLDRFPFECPRQLVIDVANWYRDYYGGEVWVKAWERRANDVGSAWGCHIITDLRFPEEVVMLKKYQSLIIYIEREEAELNLKVKQAAGDKMATNVSESHYTQLKSVANAVVTNNEDVHDLHNTVRNVVKNGLGFWGNWEERRRLESTWTGSRALIGVQPRV